MAMLALHVQAAPEVDNKHVYHTHDISSHDMIYHQGQCMATAHKLCEALHDCLSSVRDTTHLQMLPTDTCAQVARTTLVSNFRGSS